MHTLALVLALSLSAPPAAPAADGNAAYERLKKLEGSWKTDGKDGPVQFVTLRFVGAGSSILETTTGADRGSISAATVYSFEGTRLVVTHYGAGGTSRLDLAGANDSTLKFDGASKDARVAGLVLTVKDNKLTQEWTVREGGREVKKTVSLLREYVDTLK